MWKGKEQGPLVTPPISLQCTHCFRAWSNGSYKSEMHFYSSFFASLLMLLVSHMKPLHSSLLLSPSLASTQVLFSKGGSPQRPFYLAAIMASFSRFITYPPTTPPPPASPFFPPVPPSSSLHPGALLQGCPGIHPLSLHSRHLQLLGPTRSHHIRPQAAAGGEGNQVSLYASHAECTGRLCASILSTLQARVAWVMSG